MAVDYALRLFLMEHGYHLGRKAGEGYFREAYEVLLQRGALKKRFIAKIEKKNVQGNSVQHAINLSKGNLLENEIGMLGTLLHPNVVEIHDVLMKEKETIMIEEYFDALSLEQLAELRGKVQNNGFFKHIFSQVLDALHYLHVERKVLHRDLKPSNILIAKRGDLVKITDFQNAKKLEDLTSEPFPTRGGTAFTHPGLLNSLLTGRPNCASLKTEFYALGATMYYLLTGAVPFSYRVIAGDEGTKVWIGNRPFHLQLFDADNNIPSVSPEHHEANLEARLEQIPVRYRKLLRCLMSMQDVSSIAKDAYLKVKEAFVDATYEPCPVIKPINFAHYHLKDLAANKEPLFLRERSELSDFIEELVEGTLRYGTREIVVPKLREHGEGSDAERIVEYCERYLRSSPQRPTLVVEDTNFSYCYGTQSQGWRDTFERILKVLVDGKVVFEAKKFLGGEKGHVLEEPVSLEPLPWGVLVHDGFNKAFEGMHRFSESERLGMQRAQELCDAGLIEHRNDLLEFLNMGTLGVRVIAEQGSVVYNRKMKADEVGGFFTFDFDGVKAFSPFVRFNRRLLEEVLPLLDQKGSGYDCARKNAEGFRRGCLLLPL